MSVTSIEWTATILPDGTVVPGYSFNPWVGCTKVSPACDSCYAESWAKRTGQAALWQGERRRTSVSNWRQPLKWDRAAAAAGVRRRVFCASLADVFDNQVPEEWRLEMWDLIWRCRHLDWLLLTKRPQNIAKMLPPPWGSEGYPNVWLGTTAENQEEADRRIPHLLAVPAVVRFLSCEPLLGFLDLMRVGPEQLDALGYDALGFQRLDWVICGSESGHGARPCDLDWVRDLRDQVVMAGVPFFWKQHVERGRKIPTPEIDGRRWLQFPDPAPQAASVSPAPPNGTLDRTASPAGATSEPARARAGEDAS